MYQNQWGHVMRLHDTQHAPPTQDPKTLLTKRHRHRHQPHYYNQHRIFHPDLKARGRHVQRVFATCFSLFHLLYFSSFLGTINHGFGMGVKVSLGVSLIFAVLKMSQLLDKAKNYITEKVTDIPKPEASITDVDFKDVTRQSVEYLAKINVSNPYSTSIPICDIKYSFKSANREIASGTVPDPGSLKASDTTLLNVLVKVPHSIIVNLVKDIGADWDIDYQLDIGLVIDLPIIGNFTIPLCQKGEIKIPSISDFFA